MIYLRTLGSSPVQTVPRALYKTTPLKIREETLKSTYVFHTVHEVVLAVQMN